MEKQAVLLIHGMGEQKPMNNLRSFVETIWVRNKKAQHPKIHDPSRAWSKPDSISESFELRRLTTPRNIDEKRTDFFEFYWAHLMSGTDMNHVLGWFRFLLFRNPFTLPRKLVGVYWILLMSLLVSGFLIVNSTLGLFETSRLGSLIFGVVLLPLLTLFLRQVLGDAARYLYPAPTNVQKRHEIRSAGVKVLKKLHDRGYERIIVVGHSLGSVIGYDILNHTFASYNAMHADPSAPKTSAMEELRRMILEEDLADGNVMDKFQEAQNEYLQELGSNGNPWRVTDFVTLGSPLTHAPVLMAKSEEDFRKRQVNREIPTCPPTLEEKVAKKAVIKKFTYEKDGVEIPHFAATFAATRWSNLYFPSKWILFGDFIAGPLREVLGTGIRDVEVSTRQQLGFFSHTLYWKEADKRTTENDHITKLREAIRLTSNCRE